MRTAVALTSEEVRRLKRLRDLVVDSLWTDGWSVHLRGAGRTIAFLPEEVVVEDVFHPDADVVRLRIEEEPYVAPDAPPLAEVCGGMGRILRLAVMTTAVANAPPLHAHPEAPATSEDPTRTVALVDVGIAFETEGGWTVIATDGIEFGVHVALPGRTQRNLAVLAGRVVLTPVFTAPGVTA